MLTSQRVVVRPHMFGGRARARWRHGLWFLPLAAVNLARTSLGGALWVVGGTGAFGVLCFGLTSLQRLTLDGGTVRRRSWLGRTRSCECPAIAEVVDAPIYLTRLGDPERWLLFVGEDGRCVLRSCVSLCERDDLLAFQAALDKPWYEARLESVAEARRAYPGSFRLPWAHYWLTSLILLAVAGLTAIVVVAIVMALC